MKHLLAGLGALALIALPQIGAAASKAPAFHWKWVLTVNDDGVNIGEAEDDESNSITCTKPLTGVIEFHMHIDGVTLKNDQPIKGEMTIDTGGLKTTGLAEIDPNEDAGGADAILSVPARSPLISLFGLTGALKMTAMGHTTDSPAVPKAMAAKLVTLCGGHT